MEERVVHLKEWKTCDLCVYLKVESPKRAKYDANLTIGTWAYVCEEHMRLYGKGLGVGWGVRITK